MPLNVGTPEILIILLIAIILLGPSKIPRLAWSLGEAVREFRKASAEISGEPIQPARPVRAEQPIMTAQAKKKEVDYETIRKLAEKLGVVTEGKSEDELIKEIISKRQKRKDYWRKSRRNSNNPNKNSCSKESTREPSLYIEQSSRSHIAYLFLSVYFFFFTFTFYKDALTQNRKLLYSI